MKIGTRISSPDDLDLWDFDIAQISIYKTGPFDLSFLKACIHRCKEKNIPYVVHPVNYNLLSDRDFDEIQIIAEQTNKPVILHDIRSSSGGRLKGKEAEEFRRRIEKLTRIIKISFENATENSDIVWFWKEFADSITLDIGHLEAALIDSRNFIQSLDKEIIQRIDYVHIHRFQIRNKGGYDHQPLEEGCKELDSLKALLRRKSDLSILLELNDTERIEDNLDLLRRIKL